MRSTSTIRRCAAAFFVAAAGFGLPGAHGDAPGSAARPQVMPAEFERQDAILMCWDARDTWTREAIIDIVGAVRPRVPLMLLVADDSAQRSAERTLRRAGVSLEGIHFAQVPCDTVWTRDYGPRFVQCGDGSGSFVDAAYVRDVRERDDGVPAALALLLGLRSIQAPVNLEGGNLLSNGAGLLVTTHRTVDLNAPRELDETRIAAVLRDHLGASEVVFLEPLVDEPTGHVDMFVTFTAANTVVVGQYSPRLDPVNAEVLDRNAAALAGIDTPHGPLKVVRIPMPSHEGDVWRTHANVLFANGALLVPTYPGFDRGSRAKAIATYQALLPDWEIVRINCNHLIAQGGAIHCVTSGLGRLPRLPGNSPLPRTPRARPLVRAIGRTDLFFPLPQIIAPAAGGR